MNILLAPDKFKGTFSANEVCQLMRQGLKKVLPQAHITSCPIADGGDGFVDVLFQQLAGQWVECEVHDAMGRPFCARYALCGDIALMEMSEASGIRHVPEEARNIWQANTLGTGEMMRHAIENHQVRRIVMGIGGSVSNDGGCGMAAALGAKFLNKEGVRLDPTPRELASCAQVDLSGLIELPEILVACDVDNPLLGNKGAVRVYAPQKGAGTDELAKLESMLSRLVAITEGHEASLVAGAGAAGGLGFGLIQFCSARLQPGFELVAEETGLMREIEKSDIVITGEGKLDAQTLHGKGPAGVARLAQKAGKQVAVIAGFVELLPSESTGLFDCIYELHDTSRTMEETIRGGESLLIEKSAQLARDLGAS